MDLKIPTDYDPQGQKRLQACMEVESEQRSHLGKDKKGQELGGVSGVYDKDKHRVSASCAGCGPPVRLLSSPPLG